MRVGHELLDLARAGGVRSLFVVGTGKNVGKTVAMRAVYEAACDAGLSAALTSIGRDGEAIDAGDAQPKPRLRLQPGTVLATARGVLPRSPASRILELSDLQTAAGPLLYAQVAHAGFYELVGPPTASGIREAVDVLQRLADFIIVDGAIDRVAALAGGRDAVIVASGAAAAGTMNEAVEAASALVQRLSVPAADPGGDALRIDGALTATRAAELIAARERRQIVVRDPTQIALVGKAASHAFAHLTIRCERPLHVVAATVASIGRESAFEPRGFARAVASATGIPTFDVYAGARVA
ncbi:MAG TPA: hypothetical protein VK760_07045 [Candidatus Acidoferrales bacterium]|jgi:hypothetical protein|nr:hypothetical protein [Candidatus Acidoferrales bacterium]